MKLFKRFSLVLLSALIFVGSAFVFAGCGKENKESKLYVFSSIGGTVQVDDNEEVVKFGDEGSKIFTYKQNSTIKLKAIPDTGYQFIRWQFTKTEQDYSQIANQSEIELKLTDKEIVIKAEFEMDGSVNFCHVTYPTNTIGYTFAPERGYSTTIAEGDEFKFKINLWQDYSDSVVVVRGNDQMIICDENGIYTLIVDRDVSITVDGVKINAEPPKEYYDVRSVDNRFEIQPVGSANCTVEKGKSFTFTIKLKDGYVFDGTPIVKANGTVLTANNGKYTISSVNNTTQIVVDNIVEDTSKLMRYGVFTRDDKFVIIPIDPINFEVVEGRSFTFTVDASEGYQFNGEPVVKANNNIIPINNKGQYVIESVTCDIEITIDNIINIVPIEPEYYSIFIIDNRFDIEPVGQLNYQVAEGESFTFTITLKDGYQYDGDPIVKANGVTLTENKGQYTIGSVITNTKIEIDNIIEEVLDPMTYSVFNKDMRFVIISSSPKTDCEVIEGEDFTFTIKLKDGYKFDGTPVVKANGNVLTANDGEYTITNVRTSYEITIDNIVEITSYKVYTNTNLFKIVKDGQTIASDTWDVDKGASFTFSIEISEGYYEKDDVVVWCDDNVLTGNNGKYTIDSVTKDLHITIEGVFEDVENTYTFLLIFNDEIYGEVLSENVEFTIKESEKLSQYDSEEFTFIDEFDEVYTVQDFVNMVRDNCSTLTVVGFTIGGLDFIVVDGHTITINWGVLDITGSNYELVVKVKAV